MEETETVARAIAESNGMNPNNWKHYAKQADAALAAMKPAIDNLKRKSTDRLYMLEAYRNMLGPTGLEVANRWETSSMLRVHFDWGPKAAEMTGEERAKFILDIEDAPKRRLAPEEMARPFPLSLQNEGSH